MSIPASEDTTADLKNFVTEETSVHIPVTLAGGGNEGDMIISGPWCGILDQDVAAAGSGTIHVEEGIVVMTSELAAGATFDTIGQEVWYDATAETYTSEESAGLYGVGPLREVENSNGVIKFEKRRYYIDGEDT